MTKVVTVAQWALNSIISPAIGGINQRASTAPARRPILGDGRAAVRADGRAEKVDGIRDNAAIAGADDAHLAHGCRRGE